MNTTVDMEKIYTQFKEKLGCEFDYHIYGQEDTMKLLCNVIYDTAKIKDEEFTRKHYKIEDKMIFVTSTIGMASYPSDTKDYDDLFQMADKISNFHSSKTRTVRGR